MNDLLNIKAETLTSQKIVDWGYTEELVPHTYQQYLKWVEDGFHGPLNYLGDERKLKRESLKSVFPECESALVFLFDYRDAKKFQEENPSKFKIASYTIGFNDQDYHFWIKEKLEAIAAELKITHPDLEFQISLDVHPVLERDLAQRSGLGWFGKNSMLISQEFGSYNLIGSLLLNKKFDFKTPSIVVDHCGNCTKCISACPTNAIMGDQRTVDSSKCISTYTIELFKDATPPEGYPTDSNEVFGCDICQEVCPWNDKPMQRADGIDQSNLIEFFNRDLVEIIKELEVMSNRQYKILFTKTSFERVGKQGLVKNLKYYLPE